MEPSVDTRRFQSITRLLGRLPEQAESVEFVLFDYYFHRLAAYAQTRLQRGNTRAADGDDLAQSIFWKFLTDGRDGQLPEFESRADAWRMLLKRVTQRADNHNRDAICQKRGGGRVLGEADLEANSDSSTPGVFANEPGQEPQPWEVLIVQEFNAKCDGWLEEPSLIKLFELWRNGCPVEEMARTMNCSKATVHRKVGLILDRLRHKLAED